ncbi:hypothetical protein L228DRAFT_245465 [Xylona heveae TC161]|uniref:F-box domain-containing protein n=1 Tax=Xylona heveae (strain CBS 132557 / TC161) TaxID=1328760 RepID=A0A165I7U1_XYLHT|nr:hypothetical protein L228DRAFT_245465 [Xylona heveae TC161]KZF24510.1 hypothetical protein L228DRAFT_245465 [Xylona heveae TC161]
MAPPVSSLADDIAAYKPFAEASRAEPSTEAGLAPDRSQIRGSTEDAARTINAQTLAPTSAPEGSVPSLASRRRARRLLPWTGPFRFFDLPYELRDRIYEFVLVHNERLPVPIDMSPSNPRLVAPVLDCFLTSKQFYEEAYPVFYGRNTFRLFPMDGRFFSKKPLFVRLPPHYRASVSSLELCLGRGWTSPPKTQAVTPKLGLSDAKNVRKLKIFIECDPSHEVFQGFRVDQDFYTTFATRLLKAIMESVPSIEIIEFDAWPSVKKKDQLMSRLLQDTRRAGKRITWGSNRGWRDGEEDEDNRNDHNDETYLMMHRHSLFAAVA